MNKNFSSNSSVPQGLSASVHQGFESMMEVADLGKKGCSVAIPEGVELGIEVERSTEVEMNIGVQLDKRLAGDCVLMVGMLWFRAAVHQQWQRLQTRLCFLLAPRPYSCKL
jgi:hypothetical protein